jgi:hypothetical protein
MSAKSPNYIRQKKEGLSSLTLILPTISKQRLEKEADDEGLNLASYCRSILLGKEYRQLKNHKTTRTE